MVSQLREYLDGALPGERLGMKDESGWKVL
jgi:hypothetical protein